MPNGLYFMAVFFPFLLSFLQRLISEVTERISIKLGTHIHANVDVLFTLPLGNFSSSYDSPGRCSDANNRCWGRPFPPEIYLR